MRKITLTVTISDADSATLEIAAGVLDKAPNDLLTEAVAEPFQRWIAQLMKDLRKASQGLSSINRLALQGKALAREALKKAEGQ
jgi:hypothetical protein